MTIARVDVGGGGGGGTRQKKLYFYLITACAVDPLPLQSQLSDVRECEPPLQISGSPLVTDSLILQFVHIATWLGKVLWVLLMK